MSETPIGTPSTPDPGMENYQYTAIPGDSNVPVPVTGPPRSGPNVPQPFSAAQRGWICPICGNLNHLAMPACGQCGLEATVLVVPTEALRRLRKYWETGINEAAEDMSIQDWQRALRDVFDGKDGALTVIDRALGPTGWV